MGKYRILYNYDTGDSFHNEDGLEDYIELEFDQIEVAEANMKRIEEHYKLYEECENRWNQKKNQELIAEYQDRDWFVKKTIPVIYFKGNNYVKPGESIQDARYSAISVGDIERYQRLGRLVGEVFDEYYANHCIILYSDGGKPFQIHCPWCGYFERLNFVRIVERERIIKFR